MMNENENYAFTTEQILTLLHNRGYFSGWSRIHKYDESEAPKKATENLTIDFKYFGHHEPKTDQILREMHKRLNAAGKRVSSKDYESLALLYPQHKECFEQWARALAYAESVEKRGKQE
jgi:ribosomal protein S8